jgi:hypothetical protein
LCIAALSHNQHLKNSDFPPTIFQNLLLENIMRELPDWHNQHLGEMVLSWPQCAAKGNACRKNRQPPLTSTLLVLCSPQSERLPMSLPPG